MTKYHCPYCSAHYQIHIKRADGVMVCGQCGDQLIKIPFITLTQIFALLAAGAFITPLIVMILAFVQDQVKHRSKQALAPVVAVETPSPQPNNSKNASIM